MKNEEQINYTTGLFLTEKPKTFEYQVNITAANLKQRPLNQQSANFWRQFKNICRAKTNFCCRHSEGSRSLIKTVSKTLK